MVAVLGINCLGHDASVAVVQDSEILFASHAERYSRKKEDPMLSAALLSDALSYCPKIDIVAYHERPWLHSLRALTDRNFSALRRTWNPRGYIEKHLGASIGAYRFQTVEHHYSHACGAYFTSPFDRAAIVVVDGVGDLDTMTVWKAEGETIAKVWSMRYPHSLGFLYSAFTQRVGFQPNREEYITMGLAAYGSPHYSALIERELLRPEGGPVCKLAYPLSRGLGEWHPEIHDRENIAASIQDVLERQLMRLFSWVRSRLGIPNLVFSGGVALNCVFNAKLARSGLFDRIWIMPNPGDAGNSLGAALAVIGKHVSWRGPFLGHDMQRTLPTKRVLDALEEHGVVGVAHGRAEFGPRALGHRSLLADPRGPFVKRTVNRIKRRESFRPFAPMVLLENASEYFDLPVKESPYMQFVAPCKDPQGFPAICHVDNTSRVQTVGPEDRDLHELLVEFQRRTGCPMLLNTSLNIKGEPLVNDLEDALRFEKTQQTAVL
ncbi:carbamoyltransferase [Sorangium sp. So ce1128]